MTAAVFLAAAVLTAASPPAYFTDNIASTGTSPTPTTMEKALLDRINQATISIDLAIYDFNRLSVRSALLEAHNNRGVAVRVVTDDEARTTYKSHFDALAAAGIQVIDDGRPGSIMHNKFFIFDDRIVWTGSTNISDNDFTKNHNNSLVFSSTAVADIYGREFDQMMAGSFSVAKSPNPTTTVSAGGVPLEIYFSPKDNAMSQVIDEVNNATGEIVFSIFFFTDDGLRDALIAARQRKVAVLGIWDLLGASNSYSDDEALCAAGIPIKIENFIGKMHNKFMVIDAGGGAPRVVTGSLNWTASGNNANDENTMIVHDGSTAQAYRANFQTLWDALPAETACQTGPVTVTGRVYLPQLAATTSPAPGAPDVRIAIIVYDPEGSDVLGENVKIENRGSAPQNLAGWKLSDLAGNTYTFPSFSLGPGQAVTVWVGSGSNDAANLFWGRGSPVWNNSGDTAFLKNDLNALVDQCAYTTGDGSHVCP